MKNTSLAGQVFRDKVFCLNLSLKTVYKASGNLMHIFLYLSAAAVENLFDFLWVRYL